MVLHEDRGVVSGVWSKEFRDSDSSRRPSSYELNVEVANKLFRFPISQIGYLILGPLAESHVTAGEFVRPARAFAPLSEPLSDLSSSFSYYPFVSYLLHESCVPVRHLSSW